MTDPADPSPGSTAFGQVETPQPPDFAGWFRACAPYFNAHRGRLFVIQFDGDAILDDSFASLIHDIALLHMLGVRVVLVHGARPQMEASLADQQLASPVHDGVRVTDDRALATFKQVVGAVRVQIEALLSVGVANSPMAGARIRVHTGNFVTARPLGVHDGIDFVHTGEVRRIDRASIEHQLDNDAIVLISPIGYSPTGEVFNLNSLDLATRLALDIQAAKLVFLAGGAGLHTENGVRIGEFTVDQARHWLRDHANQSPSSGSSAHRPSNAELMQRAVWACQGGVDRVHLVNRLVDGALLHELYTRDGLGTMVNADPYDTIRTAAAADLGGIMELIEPLEQQGLLVARTREQIETEIEAHTVVVRDGVVIGCAAVHHLDEQNAELACFAVSTSYQIAGIGRALLDAAEQRARREGASSLFVLTTQALHWFKERGFRDSSPTSLPQARRSTYNAKRNSRVLIKDL